MKGLIIFFGSIGVIVAVGMAGSRDMGRITELRDDCMERKIMLSFAGCDFYAKEVYEKEQAQ